MLSEKAFAAVLWARGYKTTTSCEMWPNDQLKCEFPRSASLFCCAEWWKSQIKSTLEDSESSGGCKTFDMWQKQQSMMWFLVRATYGSYFLSFCFLLFHPFKYTNLKMTQRKNLWKDGQNIQHITYPARCLIKFNPTPTAKTFYTIRAPPPHS